MKIYSMQLGMIGTNCYIFHGEDSTRCGIIDPGDDGLRVAYKVKELGLEPEAVVLTHAHFDHILGIPGLRSVWPDLPVYCHSLEVTPEQETYMFGETFPTVSSMGNIRTFEEGDTLTVGGVTLKVLHTPGHTRGSCVLMAEDILFTGDTLFRGSMGRTDLPGGDDAQMIASLARLGNLPGDYQVLPGHESGSTLEQERRRNPYLKQAMQG